jgi:hypothetical protein
MGKLPTTLWRKMMSLQAIHGIFRNCSGETIEPPMPATASNRKVTYVMPIRNMKSAEIEQEEYDKFYESTVNNNSLGISKEKLKQNLLQIVNQKKKLKITQGHPFIREMLWRMEDNPTDESALDMVVMMIDTDTQKSIHPLNDTINTAHQIEAMMRQTPEPDTEEMIKEEEEDPDEEPPGDHVTKKEVEKAQLDALYPKIRVFSDDEKQQTPHTMSTMPVNTYKEAVENETYRGNKSDAQTVEGKIAQMDALYPTTRVQSDCEKQKTTNRMSAIHESTHKEDVMTVTFQEDVVNKIYQKNTMSAMHESNYQEDVDDKAYMKNVVVPGAVANTSSSNDGPDDPQHNCMMGKPGTQDDTKRLAVTAITSERGGRG